MLSVRLVRKRDLRHARKKARLLSTDLSLTFR